MIKEKGNFYKDLWDVLKKAFNRWNDADPFRQSAIIAFYAIFSIPALLVIIIAISGYFIGEEAVEGKLSEEIGEMLGRDAAIVIEVMIANAVETGSSVWAAIFGIALLIFGATTVFFQLQKSLNRIWGVKPKPGKAFIKYFKDRLFSFGLILAIGFLMLISLLLTSLLAVFGEWLQEIVPDFLLVIFVILNFLIFFGVMTVLFALMYKILPDAIIKWRSVWIGAIVTAFLFEIGKYALSIYFGEAEPGSVYGGAGSIVLILLWVSYVCMILFFGAEFTRQYAIKFGHGIKPKPGAELIGKGLDDPFETE